jgi:hypothetical protein
VIPGFRPLVLSRTAVQADPPPMGIGFWPEPLPAEIVKDPRPDATDGMLSQMPVSVCGGEPVFDNKVIRSAARCRRLTCRSPRESTKELFR